MVTRPTPSVPRSQDTLRSSDDIYPFEAARPKIEDAKHPLSPEVASWLQVFMRAVRGRRLYPMNNPVLQGYLSRAVEGLAAVHMRQPRLTFRVREDRLFFEGDAVLVDPDRVEGLPFVLFSHSVQQIELKQGLDLAEMARLTELLSRDYGGEAHGGEDLITALWRAHLAHFEYTVIDVYTLDDAQLVAVDPSALVVDDEMRRIREELGRIARALRGQPLQGDLHDEADVRDDPLLSEDEGDDLPDDAAAWDPGAMQLFAGQVDGAARLAEELRATDEHDTLVGRLTELLVSALRAEGEALEDTPGWRLLLALLDSVLRGRQFDEALKLVDLLTGHLLAQPRPEDRALAGRLLEYLGSPAAVGVVLEELDRATDPAELRTGLQLLERLGRHAFRAALMHLGAMTQAHPRRQVTELLTPFMGEDPMLVVEVLRLAPAEVVREVLGLGEALPITLASDLIWVGAEHADAGVRARAVTLLRGFGGTRADQLVARAIQDVDATVRSTAIRAAAHRRCQVVLDALVAVLRRPDLDELEQGELKLVLSAAVAVGGNKITPTLSRLLNESGALGLRRHGTELQVAVAHALGALGTPEAQAALLAGTRTLNRRVKAACTAALAARSAPPLHLDLPNRFGELEPRPAVMDRPAVPMVPEMAHPLPTPRGPAGIPIQEAPSPTPRPQVATALDTYPPFQPPPGAAPTGLSAWREPRPERVSTVLEPPPPLLDPAALRLASDVTDPPEVELVEVPTLTMRHLQDAAPPAKGDLSSLVDDLMEPRAPVVRHETVTEPDRVLPRLPSSALMPAPDDDEEAP